MTEGLEKTRKNFLQQVKDSTGKRELSFDDFDLVSRLQEVRTKDSATQRKIEGTSLNADDIYKIKKELAERYSSGQYVEHLHSDSPWNIKHISIKTSETELRAKIVINQRSLSEIERNIHFVNWVGSKKRLGYFADRDYGPFYVIMLQGVSLNKALQYQEGQGADLIMGALRDFIGEYYFNSIISSQEVKKNQAPYSVRLYAETAKRLVSKLPHQIGRAHV